VIRIRQLTPGLLKACDLLEPQLLVTALKAIKHLSTSPDLIDVLQNSNAMEVLVRLLGQNIKGPYSNVSTLLITADLRTYALIYSKPSSACVALAEPVKKKLHRPALCLY
jgi:hypothetical protein